MIVARVPLDKATNTHTSGENGFAVLAPGGRIRERRRGKDIDTAVSVAGILGSDALALQTARPPLRVERSVWSSALERTPLR